MIYDQLLTILSRTYSLETLGINNVAWHYNDIFNVIDYLAQHGYVILGGDVYRLDKNSIESTYDSWYIEPTVLEEKTSVFIAKQKAVQYINMYHARNGDNYLYSLVVEKN